MANNSTKRIVIFLVVTFALSWAYEFGVIYPANSDDLSSLPPAAVQLLVGAVMIAPAIGVAITRLVTKEGFRGTSHIAPVDFRRTWKYWAMGYFGPFLLIVAGAALYYLVVPDSFDAEMGYVETMLPPLEASDFKTWGLPIALAAAAVAPIANIFTCFGEEWGWRGYLLPKLLERHRVIPTLLASGIIWGLWHAPLTLIGHNYGLGYPGYPVTGIFAMCCFCTVIGVFMSFVTMKSGSCIPAALAHGSLNGTVSLSYVFATSASNPFVGPAATGIIGGMGFVFAAVILAALLWQAERRGEAPMRTREEAKPAPSPSV